MNNRTVIHPDSVVEAILAASSHPAKRRNLGLIHEICFERRESGNTDFSLKSIAAEVEERGGLKAKAFWNPQSADYRKLIEAWQAYAGAPPVLRETQKMASHQMLTRNIADPATRIIVEQLIRERDSLRGEVNLLKSQTVLTIDKRPGSSNTATHNVPGSNMTLEVKTGPVLNIIEKEALEHALSRELWEAEGWIEEKHGRVVKQNLGTGLSRTIFKPGLVTAIRKILKSQ